MYKNLNFNTISIEFIRMSSTFKTLSILQLHSDNSARQKQSIKIIILDCFRGFVFNLFIKRSNCEHCLGSVIYLRTT